MYQIRQWKGVQSRVHFAPTFDNLNVYKKNIYFDNLNIYTPPKMIAIGFRIQVAG
jgi:hypothetical protein